MKRVSVPQVEVLQDEVVYATEEVERLTKVLDEQNSLLQASQEQSAQKDIMIQNLQQKVKFFFNPLNTEQMNNQYGQINPKEQHFIKMTHFSTRCNNSKKPLKELSEMEVSNLTLSPQSHLNHYLG